MQMQISNDAITWTNCGSSVAVAPTAIVTPVTVCDLTTTAALYVRINPGSGKGSGMGAISAQSTLTK